MHLKSNYKSGEFPQKYIVLDKEFIVLVCNKKKIIKKYMSSNKR